MAKNNTATTSKTSTTNAQSKPPARAALDTLAISLTPWQGVQLFSRILPPLGTKEDRRLCRLLRGRFLPTQQAAPHHGLILTIPPDGAPEPFAVSKLAWLLLKRGLVKAERAQRFPTMTVHATHDDKSPTGLVDKLLDDITGLLKQNRARGDDELLTLELTPLQAVYAVGLLPTSQSSKEDEALEAIGDLHEEVFGESGRQWGGCTYQKLGSRADEAEAHTLLRTTWAWVELRCLQAKRDGLLNPAHHREAWQAYKAIREALA